MRQLLILGIVGYLVYQLSLIGWDEVWNTLPRTLWFYVAFLGFYVALPLFQTLAFWLIWDKGAWNLLPAMLVQRVFDKDVLGRSGDVYVYFWARSHVDHTGNELLHHVKDNAIMSSSASTVVALVLLGAFLIAGYVPLPDIVAGHKTAFGLAAAGVLALVVGAGVRFRRTVFLLPARLLALLFAVHLVRVFVLKGLHVVEWTAALPEVSLGVWFTFLAVQIITTRIPFMPSRDLLFMAAGLELAGTVPVSKASIAGLLGVHSVLDKSMNLAVFVVVSAWKGSILHGGSDRLGTRVPAPEKRTAEVEGEVLEVSSPQSSTS